VGSDETARLLVLSESIIAGTKHLRNVYCK